MKTLRTEHDGRLVGLAVDRGRVLIHYGDLVSILPSCWADALPHSQRISVAGQVYADPKQLTRLSKSDAVEASARKALTSVLDALPHLTKEVSR